ncbi:hypothetical protein SAMN04489732_12733 [Amycolatopsis saalfeldensis]|uniref:Uncharacterized protein n=1 Tax=Amycolatopsis saalfeldensis TaxID=394193 RepID=A0A1H8YMM6_9PSEU|nr:hypothetical protein SAMN04489732_12733 [Amycolatopsis saalfeldensis]
MAGAMCGTGAIVGRTGGGGGTEVIFGRAAVNLSGWDIGTVGGAPPAGGVAGPAAAGATGGAAAGTPDDAAGADGPEAAAARPVAVATEDARFSGGMGESSV